MFKVKRQKWRQILWLVVGIHASPWIGNRAEIVAGGPGFSKDNRIWTPETLPEGFENNRIRTVEYGDELWIATDTVNNLYSKRDSGDWRHEGTLPFGLDDIHFANGIWVGGGYDGVMISDDGVSWRTLSVGFSAPDFRVLHANGTWVAGDVHGKVFISNDGSNWRRKSPPSTWSAFNVMITYEHIAYGDGRWFVIARDGTVNEEPLLSNPLKILSSNNDGDSWHWFDVPDHPRSMAYGSGKWVLSSGPELRVSDDARSWNDVPITEEIFVSELRYANGEFLAADIDISGGEGVGFRILSSLDGIKWRASDRLKTEGKWVSDVAYGNGTWMVVGESGTVSSELGDQEEELEVDDRVWVKESLPDDVSDVIAALEYGNGRWIATDDQGRVLSRTGGSDWETLSQVPVVFSDLKFADGRWVGVGSDDSAMVSTDGENWEDLMTPGGFRIEHISIDYGEGQWAIGGFAAREILLSNNLVDWNGSRIRPGSFNPIDRIVFVEGRWVVFYNFFDSAFVSKDNGESWGQMNVPTLYIPSSLAFGDGKWVLGGTGSGTPGILTSVDGDLWEAANIPIQSRVTFVEFGGGEFLAVDEVADQPLGFKRPRIFTSGDGNSWKVSDPGIDAVSNLPTEAITNLKFGNGQWLLTANGCIYSNGDAEIVFPERPDDLNDNGIPDVWEERHFGVGKTVNPWVDSDGDGVPNWKEILFGLDPNDPESKTPIRAEIGVHDETGKTCLIVRFDQLILPEGFPEEIFSQIVEFSGGDGYLQNWRADNVEYVGAADNEDGTRTLTYRCNFDGDLKLGVVRVRSRFNHEPPNRSFEFYQDKLRETPIINDVTRDLWKIVDNSTTVDLIHTARLIKSILYYPDYAGTSSRLHLLEQILRAEKILEAEATTPLLLEESIRDALSNFVESENVESLPLGLLVEFETFLPNDVWEIGKTRSPNWKPHRMNLSTRQREREHYGGFDKCVSHQWSDQPLNLAKYLVHYDINSSLFEDSKILDWRVNGQRQETCMLFLGEEPISDAITQFKIEVLPKGGHEALDTLIITVAPRQTLVNFELWAFENMDLEWTKELPKLYSRVFDPLDKLIDPEPENCLQAWSGVENINTFYHPDGKYGIRSHKTNGGHSHQAIYDSSGELITSGISAGSVDKEAPFPDELRFWRHFESDVQPFVWAVQLDGNPCEDFVRFFEGELVSFTMTNPAMFEGWFIQGYYERRPAIVGQLESSVISPGDCSTHQ